MTGVSDVLAVLEDAGFERLPKPLTIAGTELDFEAAARGTGTSHDLVLVSTDQVPKRRLRRLVAGLAQSLDRVSSRRPVTLILLGGVAAADRTELERYARVLSINSSAPSLSEIKEAVAVLLPLQLPKGDLTHGSNPVNELLANLEISSDTTDHIQFIRAAANGPDAVRETLRRYMNDGVEWHDEEEVNHE